MRITANVPGKGLANIELQSDRIRAVRIVGPEDPEKPLASPGFIDIQLNGYAGVNFCAADLTPEAAISVLPALWKTGVTSFCPTLITNSIQHLRRNLQVLETTRRMDRTFARTVSCYHLEGPYLSSGGARGCHDPTLMRSPNWDEFMSLQEAAGGNIAIVTLAPELPGATEFIRQASSSGLIVAIGHTDANPEQIRAAVDAGARLSTHLGNACPDLIHRHENPLWAQIADDRLAASLICDGFHVPRDFVRTIFRAKGIENCILITDAVHVADLPPGEYSLVGRQIKLLPSGKVITSDGKSMAGSTLSMNRAIAVFAEFSQTSLKDSLRAATTNPAQLLQREDACSDIGPGQPANLVFFRPSRDRLRIERVFLRGELVFAVGDSALNNQFVLKTF